MAVEFFDHTADVGARVSAASLDELFAEAALAFTATVTDPDGVAESTTTHVSLHASDLDQLLVDWLSELVGLFDIGDFLPSSTRVTIHEGGADDPGWHLEASATGERCEPARHPLKVLVKGITYHGLGICRTSDRRWQTSVIFDV